MDDLRRKINKFQYIIEIRHINLYTYLFSRHLDEYKYFINISYENYNLHNIEELIKNLCVVDNLVDLVQYFYKTLTLEEIFTISEYILNKRDSNYEFYLAWCIIGKSAFSFTANRGRKLIMSYEHALLFHNDLKSYLNKP